MLEHRVGDLERELRGLERRIAEIEGHRADAAWVSPPKPAPARPQRAPVPVPAPAPAPAPTPAPKPVAAPKPRRERPQIDLEDLVGGRVLAWLGGVAVLVGLAFLMALAISSGWIGEGARTVIGGVAAAALMAVGVWLHEQKGRTDAALASLSAGVAAMFAVAAVATSVYEVIPAPAGLALGMATGALATWLAVRWESQGIAALGILGAMLAPAVAGASDSGMAMAVLFVAGVAAVSVLTSQGWRWLSFGTVLLALPQWVVFLGDGPHEVIDVAAALIGFGVLGAMAAVGHELRATPERMSASSGFLLVVNALAVGGAGWFALDAAGGRPAAVAGVWVLAACHVAVALWARRRHDLPDDLALLLFSVGTVIADVAFAVSFDGPPRTIGWAATSVAFAALVRRHRRAGGATEPAAVGLGAHLALALVQAVASDATPVLLGHDDPSLAAGGALVVLAAACFVSGRLAEERGTPARMALDSLGLLVLGYLTVITMSGLPLVLALVGEGVALAGLARRDRDPVAQWGMLGALALGIGYAIGLAPVSAFADGLDRPLIAAAALGAAAVGCVLSARLAGEDQPELRGVLHAAAIAVAGYLTLIELDGQLLVAVLCAEAVALAAVARVREDEVVAWGSLAAILTGLGFALSIAPPAALIVGLPDPLAATGALVAVAVGLVVVALAGGFGPYRRVLLGAAPVVLLYLASVLVVTPFQPDGAAAGATVVDLPVRQQGQVLLSALWALCGAVGIVVGLVRDLRPVRLAALGLVLVAVGKVFLYDLATLTSVYRVASFIALGVLLLGAAFVWQRVRPRAVPDLREVPNAVR